jgi:hypothetical protein
LRLRTGSIDSRLRSPELSNNSKII